MSIRIRGRLTSGNVGVTVALALATAGFAAAAVPSSDDAIHVC
jgi:hypothetical protein